MTYPVMTFPQRRAWTTGDLNTLRRDATLGATRLAAALDRTPNAIRLQAARQRISLRPPGTRGGRILGQPTDPTLRTLFVTDPDTATRYNQTATNSATAPLCPVCAHRPQAARLGMCRPCHLRALADAHRDDTATADAHRDLDQARQAKHRAGPRVVRP